MKELIRNLIKSNYLKEFKNFTIYDKRCIKDNFPLEGFIYYTEDNINMIKNKINMDLKELNLRFEIVDVIDFYNCGYNLDILITLKYKNMILCKISINYLYINH